MSPVIFVETLKKQSPTVAQLKNCGYSDKLIEIVLMRNNPIPKTLVVEKGIDPIITLVQSYYMGDIVIGMINFIDSIKEYYQYYFFGFFDADFMTINKDTGEILLLEEETGHILCKCAVNSDSFLNAILKASELLTNMLLSEKYRDDENIKSDYISKCADLAGGDNYIQFYQLLLL